MERELAGSELKAKDARLKRHHQQCPRMVRGWVRGESLDARSVLVILQAASCHERGRVQGTSGLAGN